MQLCYALPALLVPKADGQVTQVAASLPTLLFSFSMFSLSLELSHVFLSPACKICL